MRVIGNIQHPEIKITLFHWNNKYLIKLETDLLEQTFKIPEYDLTTETELNQVVNPQFLEAAMNRFNDMSKNLQDAVNAL
jgi:hypothetical protein